MYIYESRFFRMWILWEMSIMNVNFLRELAELFECKFHKLSLWMWIWPYLSIVIVNFMSWALHMWIL